MNMRTLNPAVPRLWLVVIAALLWCAVGAMLCLHAFDWLAGVHDLVELPLGVAGIVLGIAAHMLIFSRIAKKNADRIRSYPARACVFAFQAWRGYVLVAIMIGLGAALRHAPVPRHYLAVVYLAVGVALVTSGLSMYRRYFATDMR